MKLSNKHLEALEADHFHHLGFDTQSVDVKKEFSDVKFVCVSGSSNRISKFAKFINSQLQVLKDEGIVNLCTGDRYVMYKVGPVLMANHGMGVPSTSILMHELFKLLHYAGAEDVVFFRIGTSGGLGLTPGTVVITNRALNAYAEPKFTQVVLGKTVEQDASFLNSISDELMSLTRDSEEKVFFEVVIGDTMCCDDFYEGQARLDGAFCNYTEEDKMGYLKELHQKGVRNIEMESTLFASLCNRAGIKASVVCVALLDRLLGDQVNITKEMKTEFEQRPWWVVLKYIKKHISK